MHAPQRARLVLQAWCIVLLTTSSAVAQNAAAADFACGKPLGPCGSAIPAGVTCAKGAGWCKPGHFCGWERNTGEPSRCLPLPKDCGAVGAACCPSNADSPHTSLEDKLKRKPFCKNGNTCFYFDTVVGLNNGDMFAGNNGAYQCEKIADDCGTGPGKPCCPILYRVSTNPPLKRYGCPGTPDGYCDYEASSFKEQRSGDRNRVERMQRPGVCAAQAPGCGQIGKACCIRTGGSSHSTTCGGSAGQPRGYCRNPFAASGNPYDDERPASYSELVCTKCPDKVDASAEKTNPTLFFDCRSRP